MGQEAKSDISIWLEPDITTWPQQAISSPDFFIGGQSRRRHKKRNPPNGGFLGIGVDLCQCTGIWISATL